MRVWTFFDDVMHIRRKVFGWLRTTSGILMAVVAAMVVTVAGGFLLISEKQRELSEIREHARQMRIARQALMELDGAVLHAAVQKGDVPNLIDFERAQERVSAFPASSFPRTVAVESSEISGVLAVTQLMERLAPVVSALQARGWDTAGRAYLAGDIRDRLAQINRAYKAQLDEEEKHYKALSIWIGRLGIAILSLQLGTGFFSLLAFLYAIRRSDRDKSARTAAVQVAHEARDQVERLFSMADMLQSAADYSDANSVLRSAASELLGGFSGALYVFNNSRDRLVLSTTWGRDGCAPLSESLGMSQCWALKRGKPHINRPHSRKLCCEHHHGADFALEVPMSARGEVLGLLQIYAQGEKADERLLAAQGLATAIADATSLALANIALRDKLRGQALRDPLTGLYNRRYMEDTLQRFARLAEREDREFSAVMIDLDHFKRLNDQYGHAKGDAVLRDAAAAITSQLRATDVACRYGGEELIVLLPDCGVDMAAVKAEHIRLSIEALSEDNGAKVSASIGVASIPSTSKTAKDLVTNADAALYQAKQRGRNRVVRAPARATPPRTRGGEAQASAGETELVAAE